MNYEDGILRSLRRITRAIDLYSRQLAASCGLTGPQLVCLRHIERVGPLTPSRLAREVALSQATVTGIVDRLEAQGLVTRERSRDDRRRVTVGVTAKGRELLGRAPSALHDRFLEELKTLPEERQHAIHATLELVVSMMGAQDIDAAPILTTGPMDVTAEKLEEFLGGESPSPPPRPPEEP